MYPRPRPSVRLLLPLCLLPPLLLLRPAATGGDEPAYATAAPVSPRTRCDTPDHRRFDFWLGTWDVHRPDGERVGRNVIRSVFGGCALHESYDGRQGYHGESFNAWDAGRGVWHQTWMDNGGLVLLLDGGSETPGSMTLSGTTFEEGEAVEQRITWSRTDGDPDRVRQLWERSTDGGATWSVAFDGRYVRVAAPAAGGGDGAAGVAGAPR